MADPLSIGKIIGIRDCDYDEVWLQDQIVGNPSSLGLGDLKVVARERRQSSGGRLDILLTNLRGDSMYEVEVMLGETDETHIIRTIEYWSRERRKWPKRQHFPVLVAETITRRFFDVIQVLSYAIPLMAIQATIVEANGNRVLTFQKILDAYDEPEDKDDGKYKPPDETFWSDKAPWTNETAKALLRVVQPVFANAELNYKKSYITINVNKNDYFWFYERAANNSALEIWLGERLINTARPLLDSKGIRYTVQKNGTVLITTDRKLLEENADVYRQLGQLVQQASSE